jgi:hypothetical protein
MPSSFRAKGPLRAARRRFRGLPAPPNIAGHWRVEFCGPLWLRTLAPLGLSLSVLRGWRGKSFDAEGRGHNLIRRGGRLQPLFVMQAERRASRLDGGPVIATHYGEEAPLMLLRVSDEFRQLGADTLLGMMTIDLPGLRSLALPFLLHRAAAGELV